MSDQPTDNGESLAPVPAVKAADRTPMTSGGQISAIVPRDHVEAFRFAEAFVHAGMIPPSYGIKRNAQGKEVKEWGYWEPLMLDPPKVRINGETLTKPMATYTWRWTPYNKHLHAYEFDAALQRRRELAEMESG